MSRSTVALAALLAISAALNVLLLARGRSEAPRPTAARPPAARDVATPSAPADEARATIDVLEARIRELEADKRILAEPAPGVDRLAALREKLRRVAAIFAAGNPDFGDPEDNLAYTEASFEVSRLTLDRSKDPKAYADMLRMLYELALEKPPLPEAQKALIARTFDEFAAAVVNVRANSAGEKLLKQIELEAAAIERVRAAIGPERADQLSSDPILSMSDSGSVVTSYLSENTRDQEIIETWSKAYGLDDAQKQAAQAVARAFTAEMKRLGGSPAQGIFPPTGTPEAYKLRADLLRAQLAALQQLEGGWTREQRDRLRTRAPRDFLILPAQAVVEEEK